jgi:hypothetical protein
MKLSEFWRSESVVELGDTALEDYRTKKLAALETSATVKQLEIVPRGKEFIYIQKEREADQWLSQTDIFGPYPLLEAGIPFEGYTIADVACLIKKRSVETRTELAKIEQATIDVKYKIKSAKTIEEIDDIIGNLV